MTFGHHCSARLVLANGVLGWRLVRNSISRPQKILLGACVGTEMISPFMSTLSHHCRFESLPVNVDMVSGRRKQ